MNDVRKNYYNKANNLIDRLFGEADENTTTPDQTQPDVGAEDAGVTDEEEPQEEPKEEAAPVEIFFDNLDDETKENLMSKIIKSLNATEEDEVTKQKIRDHLSKEPLVSLMSDELVRKLNIEV